MVVINDKGWLYWVKINWLDMKACMKERKGSRLNFKVVKSGMEKKIIA